MLAFKFNAVCVAVETGLFKSEVLSTLDKSTMTLDRPPTNPVNVGDAMDAYLFTMATLFS